VPNPSKGAGQNSPAKNPPFEEALKKLEGIVEAMESNDLPLETLLSKYEEGTKLVKNLPGKTRRGGVEDSTVGKKARRAR